MMANGLETDASDDSIQGAKNTAYEPIPSMESESNFWILS